MTTSGASTWLNSRYRRASTGWSSFGENGKDEKKAFQNSGVCCPLRRRRRLLTMPTDLIESADENRLSELQSVVSEILFNQFPREAFLDERWAAMWPTIEVLFEVTPSWLEWDVLGGEEEA